MNTTEKVVEAYFRLCRGCFTMSDVKVVKGVNRQIDLLAVDLKNDRQYHVEVSVTHEKAWCPDPHELVESFDKKFLGVPPKREGKKTDHKRGKNYKREIWETYRKFNLDPERVIRVWVCWTVKNDEDMGPTLRTFCTSKRLPEGAIEILSFRDRVLPDLRQTVGTAYYDDDMLRVISLLQQGDKQRTHQTSRS